MLVIRDLVRGARRTTELLVALHPISSRTLVGRLRDMERDALIERKNYGGSPPHVEYVLTQRGRLLVPMLDALRQIGESLGCNDCDNRKRRTDSYCNACPRSERAYVHSPRRAADDSIVLL